MHDQHLLLLGEIKGQVGEIKADQAAILKKVDAIDGRLRAVEQRSAVSGATFGTLAALVVAVGTELAKGAIGKY